MNIIPLTAITHCGQQLTVTVIGLPFEGIGILTVTADGELSRQVSVIHRTEATVTFPVSGIQDLVLGYQGRVGNQLVAGYDHYRIPTRCPEDEIVPMTEVVPLRIVANHREIIISLH